MFYGGAVAEEVVEGGRQSCRVAHVFEPPVVRVAGLKVLSKKRLVWGRLAEKYLGWLEKGFSLFLLGFLRGICKKTGSWWLCFCGEIVVKKVW
jgi:hypothetical protein